jgi:riboflavin kinase/FMN adenylyltransferase
MMEFSSILSLQTLAPNWVLTLGNFDGVHKGHQALLDALQMAAQKWACPKAVVTFEPHPREFFQNQQNPSKLWPRIWGSWDLNNFLRSQKIEALVEQTFDYAFSQISAADYLRTYIRPLAPKTLIVGHDFAFGKDRQGSLALLVDFGREIDCEIVVVNPVLIGDQRVSTTQIKKYLEVPDLENAKLHLGRSVSLGGPVEHGQARGRTIGVPTANIGVNFFPALARGVYAVHVDLLDGSEIQKGVANLGINPTVSQNGNETKLEVHIFDFSRDIYGKNIQVNFVKYLRPEKKFDSLTALKNQISEDARQARECLQ